MANVNAILNQRIKKSETSSKSSSKMAAMAQQSANGNLTSFAGIFSIVELSEKEKDSLEHLLKEHAPEERDITADLQTLISITSEVKAINNQAAILHGERIKKAHRILTSYQDGAFTAWLIAAYGNRQTPYNLMQYYEFYEAMPKYLRPQIEAMPRQAIYVLATRSGSLDQKQKIVENYQGETKGEMLSLIRQTFPLNRLDKRRQKVGESCIQMLQRLVKQLKESPAELTKAQKEEIFVLLRDIKQLVG